MAIPSVPSFALLAALATPPSLNLVLDDDAGMRMPASLAAADTTTRCVAESLQAQLDDGAWLGQLPPRDTPFREDEIGSWVVLHDATPAIDGHDIGLVIEPGDTARGWLVRAGGLDGALHVRGPIELPAHCAAPTPGHGVPRGEEMA
ncbi:hypothetical protein [Luteimonas sp. e5]